MGKKFKRLLWAIKANGGVITDGKLKQFYDWYNNANTDSELDIYPHLIPIKIKSFYSDFIYETTVSKLAIENANSLIDLQVLNWMNEDAIVQDHFIPAKIIISKIGNPVTKISKITGWEYTTKVQGKYSYPIGKGGNSQDMAIALEKAVNSAKGKNPNNLITVEPERWI